MRPSLAERFGQRPELEPLSPCDRPPGSSDQTHPGGIELVLNVQSLGLALEAERQTGQGVGDPDGLAPSPNRSSYAWVTAIRRDSGVPGAGTST